MELDPAPPAAAPHLEHAVEIEGGVATRYPPALASHEAVLEDRELFMGLLEDLIAKLQDAEPHQFRPGKFRIPTGEEEGCCAAGAAALLV
jgi:hypothetical protein